ncbi:MAG: coproporphyrinogen III oxidase [Pedobacter sp.]|nr:coproporphyrinogen III oxidase [Pedobacter sp.]
MKNPYVTKKLILSLAFAVSIMVAGSACNSTKSVSEGANSTMTDTSVTPVDSTAMPVESIMVKQM